ncbi:MAG: adenylate/guanylate cyclase domain-containing protein [Myxococcales bacterium]
MKTANLAIVFTDIKGFTARTSQQGFEENRRMLRLHDALLMPVFKAFGGRKIKTIGDAFLVVFESPTQAVLCGVAIQDRLWDFNRRVGEPEQIHVRVAINMGEVRLENGDVFGEPVNIAARVEGVADAGEVVFTEAVYLSMNKAEVPSEDRGQHELKGIPEKVRVYRVPRGAYRLGASPEKPAEPPVASPAESPPYGGLALSKTNLPVPEPTTLLNKDWTELAATGAQSARKLSGQAIEAARKVPARLWLSIAAGALATLLLVGLVHLVSSVGKTPVEQALAKGDVRGAEQELRKLSKGPEREYLEGRVEEEKKDYADASKHYAEAARQNHEKSFARLLEMTESEQCWARANAAVALGRLGRKGAVDALEDLAQSSFSDENAPSSGLGGLFGRTCDSKVRASEALKAIDAKGRE